MVFLYWEVQNQPWYRNMHLFVLLQEQPEELVEGFQNSKGFHEILLIVEA